MSKDESKASEKRPYLNVGICKRLREAINSTPIFSHDKKYMAKYNLMCAIMSRIASCVNKLNTYSDYPDSEEDFIVFLTFGCMIVDAWKIISKELGIESKEKNEYKYFKRYYETSNIYNIDAEIPTDDKFFEYFRALAFAHPFETSRPKFLKNGETQYSPWVSVNKSLSFFHNMKNAVGIRIYSSLSEDIFRVMMPFSVIKGYIKSKHEKIRLVTDWVKQEIKNAHEEWQKIKINRQQDTVAILNEIKSVLEQRYENAYSIENALSYLTCHLTIQSNIENIDKFRKAIESKIPSLCDSVDALDYEKMEDALAILYETPKVMHQMAHYQLEKIYSYLDERSDYIDPASNEYWGLQQAYEFSQEFAKNWVTIDVRTMQYDEIKLLVAVACYLEKEKQDKAKEQ